MLKRKIKKLLWHIQGGYKPKEFWDNWAPTFGDDEWQRMEHAQHAWMLKRIRQSKPKTILEVGCGFGRNIQFLLKNGFPEDAITGTDISGEMIHQAKKYLKNSHVKLLVAPASDLPFPDNAFDITLIHGVFMHIKPEELVESLREIKRVTKKYIVQVEQNYEAGNDYTFIHSYKTIYRREKLDIIEYLKNKDVGLDYIYAKVR